MRRKISGYWNESEKENEQTIGIKMKWREKKKEMNKNCTDFGVYFRDIFMLKNVGQ